MLNNNLWAPWRIDYLRSFGKDEGNLDDNAPEKRVCFLCAYQEQPNANDRDNLLIWRTKNCIVLMNRYPYTGGHILIAPTNHVPNLDQLDHDTLLDLMLLCRDVQKLLDNTIHPHGYNIGINVNRCAGAGLPDHIHMHVVPRWNGDTNFMSTVGNARVISQGLFDLYDELIQSSHTLHLPTIDQI